MASGRVLSLRVRAAAIACALLAGLAAALPSVSHAQSTRTLKLHFTHTGERGVFTYRRNGQYDRKELERINHILRDWRRGEPTRMDPALLDLLWEIHRRTGSDEYIHVISAYRSPTTNEALRRRSSAVAKNSQHTRGKAMDFFIPGVPLTKLRAIALTIQGGGVGYYPGSGSPFVHVDTGSVRHWPRMTRQQLASLFPNGETLHLPSDGKPLPGYERAVAKYKRGQSIAVASAGTGSSGDRGGMSGWLQRVFSRGEGDGPAGRQRPAAASQPTVLAQAEPRRAEPPQVMPAPRPEEDDETILAESEADEADAASPPMPRAVPAKVRALLMAARDRARLIQMASAATEPPPAPADSLQALPATPAAVAALGSRERGVEPDPTSADAALAGLYAAARGGDPEPAAARLMNAAAVQPEQAYAPVQEVGAQPMAGELAVALLEMGDMGGRSQPAPAGGTATASAAPDARSGPAAAADQGSRSAAPLELAYVPADAAGGTAAEPPSRGSGPQAEPSAVSATLPVPLVAVNLDQPLLRRLMSQETTRTGAFGLLARPRPRADIYLAPADGGSMLALAHIAQPRTDRFQRP